MPKCNCPTPPGGEVECESGQLCTCIVKNGRVFAKCSSPPDHYDEKAVKNWVLEVVTEIPRDPYADISSVDDEILRQGKYVSPDGKLEVTFLMPTQGQELGA